MKAPDPKQLQRPVSELRSAVDSLRPYFRRCAWFTLIASLLVLMPSWYMLEVYDRVINSRNHLTLLMLTVLVLWAFGAIAAVRGLTDWGFSFENQSNWNGSAGTVKKLHFISVAPAASCPS